MQSKHAKASPNIHRTRVIAEAEAVSLGGGRLKHFVLTNVKKPMTVNLGALQHAMIKKPLIFANRKTFDVKFLIIQQAKYFEIIVDFSSTEEFYPLLV